MNRQYNSGEGCVKGCVEDVRYNIGMGVTYNVAWSQNRKRCQRTRGKLKRHYCTKVNGEVFFSVVVILYNYTMCLSVVSASWVYGNSTTTMTPATQTQLSEEPQWSPLQIILGCRQRNQRNSQTHNRNRPREIH